MTRRVRASSLNVSSEGQVTPYPSVGVGLAVPWTWAGSLIRGRLTRGRPGLRRSLCRPVSLGRGMSHRRAQVVVVEAGACAGVAGRADLVHPHEQRVTVTVQ